MRADDFTDRIDLADATIYIDFSPDDVTLCIVKPGKGPNPKSAVSLTRFDAIELSSRITIAAINSRKMCI